MVTFLSHFTPSMMPEDVIERIFVQRKRLASRLVTLVRESVLGTAKHHTLIVGPRGIGKTHLASLVYHRVRALPELADRIRIAWLREEEWGIASFLDFVIRVLRALDEEYPQAGMAARIDGLFAYKPEQAEREAVALLDEFVGNRTVFLLTENLDQLFEGLDDVGQQQFRAYLQDRASWTILATAPGLFSGISLQSSPFYGFFRVRHLSELSVDEAIELLQKIAELSDREDLASFVNTPVGRARIRAVHHLAGGNHRIYVIFSEFLTRETLDDLVDPFLTTMDHLTPYYQARMQSLSPQMRKIIEYLCAVRHAVPVKEIAQRCFITQQTASSQLKQLKERGFVRSFVIGRESHYELLEPLLRLSLEVKKQRGEPIRLFVDFLRFWYTRPELEARLNMEAIVSTVDREYLLRALEAWDPVHTLGETHLHEWDELLAQHLARKEFSLALEYSESLVRTRGAPDDYFRKATCLMSLGKNDEAMECVLNAHRLAPDAPEVILALGAGYGMLKRWDEALSVIDSAYSPDTMPALGWSLRAAMLGKLGRTEEALTNHERAVALEPDNADFRLVFVRFLNHLDHYVRALDVLDSAPATALDPALSETRGATLELLGRRQEAVEEYRRSIWLEETAVRRARLAGLLAITGNLDEAEREIEKAIKLDAEADGVWASAGLIHLLRGDLDAALGAIERAHQLGFDFAELHYLAGQYLERGERPGEAVRSYRKSIALGNTDPAVHFRVAAALASTAAWSDAISALCTALQRFNSEFGDSEAAVDILKAWLRNRPPQHWQEDLTAITHAYREHGGLSMLSTAIAKSQALVLNASVDPKLARVWMTTWRALADEFAELRIGVRLLRAGIEYYLTDDPRHLLELASEERAMVESIPGIRRLADLT